MAGRSAGPCLWVVWFVNCAILCTDATGGFQRNFTEIRNVSRALFQNASFQTQEIRLNYCGIRHVSMDAFGRMRYLQLLDLSENNVQQFVVGTFDIMRSLVELNLCCNALQSLENGIFDSLLKVTMLKLHSNRIATIDSKVFRVMIRLEQVELYGNRLTTLDGNIFESNRHVKKIWLSYNYIRGFDRSTFGHLHRLTHLNLNHNQLTDLHLELFDSLQELIDLNLSVNSISALPEYVFYYNRNLRKLSLAGNRLSTLQDGLLWHLPKLESLHVEQNRISHIGDQALPDIRSLTSVNLEDNRLGYLNSSTVASLKSVALLFLAGNPWLCTCPLQELYDIWLNQHALGLGPVCQGPYQVANLTWNHLPTAYFADCFPEQRAESTTSDPDVEQTVDDANTSLNRVLRQLNHTFDVYLGDNVSFSCDNSNAYIVWLHNNSLIDSNRGRPSIYGSSSYGGFFPSLRLNITRATFDDAGVYTCRSFLGRGKQDNNFILNVRELPSSTNGAFAWNVIGPMVIGTLSLVILCGCTVWIVKKCRPRPPVYDMPLNEPGKVQAVPGTNAALYEEVQLQPDKTMNASAGIYDELKQICRRTSVDEDGYLKPTCINR